MSAGFWRPDCCNVWTTGATAVLLGLMLALGAMTAAWAVPTPDVKLIIHYIPNGDIYEYRWKLLKLVLDHTVETDGPFEMTRYERDLGGVSQSRSIVLLKNGDIDVLTFGSNEERETDLRPIKIDILRGMLGYRILLIRKEDEAKFAAMDPKTLNRQVTLGFNSQWADLSILTGNGFRMVTSAGYDNLFYMLAAGRFDAFPRGLNEAAREIADRSQVLPTLTMEKMLALFMDYPVFFWVRKNNIALADRIERGLKLSLADGTFRQLFQRYHAREIEQVKREKRRVVYLRNPFLPPDNPTPDTSWWWKQ